MKKILLSFVLSFLFLNDLAHAQIKNNQNVNNNNINNTVSNGLNNSIFTMKLSHTEKANSIKGKSAIRLKEMLEAKFPQRIKVNLYENSSAYKKNEEVEATQLGIIDITIPEKAQIEKYIDLKELQIFDLPFLFSNSEDYKKVINGQSGQDLLNLINSKDNTIQALGYWSEGPRVFIGNQIYKSPSDFKNKNVIVDSLGINNLVYQNFNVKNVSKINSDELKSNLLNNENKIDVIELPLNEFEDLGLNNSFKYVTESNHNYSTDIVIVNRKWFNNLPDDMKLEIIKTIKETSLYNLDLINKNYSEIKNRLQKSGVIFYKWNESEQDSFKKNIVSIHSNYLNNINKNLLLEAYQEIKNK